MWGCWGAASSALPSSPTRLSPPSGCLQSHQASVDGEGSEWPGDTGDPVRLDGGSPILSGLAQLPSARPWCPAEAPAPCAPLALPAFTLCPPTAPPTIFHLFYSPLSLFLASFQSVSAHPPSVRPSPVSSCPPTPHLRRPLPRPLCLLLVLSFWLSPRSMCLSVCLSLGRACPGCLLLSPPACPRLFLAGPRLSPCRPACLSPCFPGRQP